MKVNSVSIARIQRAKGIEGRELAATIGMLPGSLSKLKAKESTKPTTARAIAEALGVDLAEILPKEPEQKGDEDNENSCH